MKVGMLWFDNDKTRTLAEKVERAVKYYQGKYGEPNCCYVNPAALEGVELEPTRTCVPVYCGDAVRASDGVAVCSMSTVLPHHFWVGVEEKKS